jgi:hypothetical protein
VRIPYERLVAWLAGPVSIVAGAAAVWLDTHFGLLGKAGLSHDQTAKAINDGLTFVVGAGVTYLGQAKWMTNLGAWWQSLQTVGQTGAISMTDPTQEPEDKPEEEQEQEREPKPETPFEDEPGYDEEGEEGVEPDQELETLEDGEGENVGPDTA